MLAPVVYAEELTAGMRRERGRGVVRERALGGDLARSGRVRRCGQERLGQSVQQAQFAQRRRELARAAVPLRRQFHAFGIEAAQYAVAAVRRRPQPQTQERQHAFRAQPAPQFAYFGMLEEVELDSDVDVHSVSLSAVRPVRPMRRQFRPAFIFANAKQKRKEIFYICIFCKSTKIFYKRFMKLIDSALSIIEEAVRKDFHGNLKDAAAQFEVSYHTLYSWLGPRRTRTPSLRVLEPILEKLGVQFSTPDAEAGREVCFVNARIVPAGELAAPPSSEDYMAAPMVGEVGAGPGYIPEEDIKSWFLVYKNQPAVRYRRNLIAVEIGPHSTSMQPILNPGDIVLVDRDDRNVKDPGHMMLVLDPKDGSGKVKRVAVADTDEGDCRITYYSDNAASNPPEVYSLRDDFLGDWERCIVGRVVWAWSDVTGK